MTKVYVDNKYRRIYDSIISRAQSQDRHKGEVYYERHHIHPKSLGGTNHKTNLVLLTAREHYVAHLLLVKFCTGPALYKMKMALDYLSKRHKSLGITTYSSERYERDRLRARCSGEHHPAYRHVVSENERAKRSNRMKGSSNPMYGRGVTEEENLKLSQRWQGQNNPSYGIGCVRPDGTRYAGENHGMFGKKHSAETRAKISKSIAGTQDGAKNHRYGIVPTEEERERQRNAMTGRKWVNDGTTQRFVSPEVFVALQNDGWLAGRLK